MILSRFQARRILDAWGSQTVTSSPDLGLTEISVALDTEGANFREYGFVSYQFLRKIADADRKCFRVEDDSLVQIQCFSETTGWSRSLAATDGAPTMLVSGFPMHRMKGTDPMTDTKAKIAALGKFYGRALDTATGLGYTAIELAKSAEEVVTVELDPCSIEIARANPWSRGLFDSKNIKQIVVDVFEHIKTFAVGEFAAVLHDPPTIQFAGELYSLEFYGELSRVLSRKGKLFHYIGDPESAQGSSLTKGAMKRLQEAGFTKVERKPEAFGVLAHK